MHARVIQSMKEMVKIMKEKELKKKNERHRKVLRVALHHEGRLRSSSYCFLMIAYVCIHWHFNQVIYNLQFAHKS